jgi:hypothetical protein
MTLWSIQPLHLYEKLLGCGVLHCDPEQNGFWVDFREAYDWLVEQMTARIGLPPQGVQYPFWAWALVDGVSKKPDLRRGIFNNYVGENVVLELEIPDCDVLLSDECNWHYVLNNWYLHDVNDAEGKWDEVDAWFDSLPPDEQDTIRKTSWERIFNEDDPDNDWDFVQATFWELKAEQVKSVRRFIGRQKPKASNA